MGEFGRHCAVQRNILHSVDHAQQAADGGGLVVAVEAEGAAYEQSLLYVAVAIEQGQDAQGAVEVGVPDALGDVRLVHIEFVGNHLAGGLPVVRILLPEVQALIYNVTEAVSLGEICLRVLNQRGDILLEEGFRIHRAVNHGGGDCPVVRGDAGGPVRDASGVGGHARGGVCPYLVDQLRVDLEPVRVVFLLAGEGRGEAVVHQAQGGAVCKPHAVPDVIHPTLFHLRIGGIHAVFLHHHEIEILDIGIVVGESAVNGSHLADCLVEHEGAFAGLVHELVLVLEAVDIAHHLPQPGSGNLVFQLCAGNLLRLAAGRGEQENHQYIKGSFHYLVRLGLAASALFGMDRLKSFSSLAGLFHQAPRYLPKRIMSCLCQPSTASSLQRSW